MISIEYHAGASCAREVARWCAPGGPPQTSTAGRELYGAREAEFSGQPATFRRTCCNWRLEPVLVSTPSRCRAVPPWSMMAVWIREQRRTTTQGQKA